MSSRSTWVLDRHEAVGRGGMVATKHPIAAEVGAEVLARGGNAVDAAVTAALVLGVVEPFMSGIGGGGYLVVHRPDGMSAVVDFGMIAPRAAHATMFPLVPGENPGMFGWPSVVDDANLHGPRAVAVPGAVDGLSLALERFGTHSWATALAPATRLAADGFIPTWHTVLNTAVDLAVILRDPETTATFAPGGVPHTAVAGVRKPLRQPALAATLRGLAEHGPRWFYDGDLGARIAEDLQARGGVLAREDLLGYRARVVEPLRGTYRGLEVLTTPTASGGPTVLQTLHQMDQADLRGMGHNSVAALHEVAEACFGAFADRFTWLADPDHVEVPLERLVSPEYVAHRRSLMQEGAASRPVMPGAREVLGVSHSLDRSCAGWGSPRMTTTHVSVIDRDGMAVSLTNTLLSGWGSGVTAAGTGILLNNGMMWFDPEPGRPNSVAGGKRPLSNMAPTIVVRDGLAMLSVGAMGGRRILNAVPQLISNVVDHQMAMQQAVTAPRIDCSTGDLQASDRIPTEVRDRLSAMGHPVVPVEEDVLGFEFASPAAVLRETDGTLRGGGNPYYPAFAVGID